MPVSVAEPIHPLAHVARGPHGASGLGLTIGLPQCEIVQVMARHGAEDALRNATTEALGLPLPGPGEAVEGNGLATLWVQPGGWMLVAPRAGEGALAARCAALASHASIIDQSHGRTLLALSGSAWREVLSRLWQLDLHPAAFPPGRVAAAPLGHVQALLRATTDGADLICFATFAEDVLEALMEAGAPFGMEVAG